MGIGGRLAAAPPAGPERSTSPSSATIPTACPGPGPIRTIQGRVVRRSRRTGAANRIVIPGPDTSFRGHALPGPKRGRPAGSTELIGDTDGALGSGTSGPVVIDSSDPGLKGFKSYDWWGAVPVLTPRGWSPEHKEETFLRPSAGTAGGLANLYVTGGDGGIFFDMTDQVISRSP